MDNKKISILQNPSAHQFCPIRRLSEKNNSNWFGLAFTSTVGCSWWWWLWSSSIPRDSEEEKEGPVSEGSRSLLCRSNVPEKTAFFVCIGYFTCGMRGWWPNRRLAWLASDEHRSRVQRRSRAQLALDERCWSRRAAVAQNDEHEHLDNWEIKVKKIPTCRRMTIRSAAMSRTWKSICK